MDRFEGFADGEGKFFRALAKNQKREWFQAHKGEFEEGWNAPLKALMAELSVAIDGQYPHCDLDDPKVFRIFRDVRFSKDKSPYKTHIGGYLPTKRTGKATNAPAAIYVHVGPEPFAAAGHYMMEGDDLARYRAAVLDDARGKELVKIIAKLEKKGFSVEARESLVRVPKGIDPEHPRANLLKNKGLIATFPKIPKGLLASPKLVKWLVAGSKDVAPFVEWLVFATA
ncbi:MAG: DUF2461 domain-containing protein [Polyangiaceae bacterium]